MLQSAWKTLKRWIISNTHTFFVGLFCSSSFFSVLCIIDEQGKMNLFKYRIYIQRNFSFLYGELFSRCEFSICVCCSRLPLSQPMPCHLNRFDFDKCIIHIFKVYAIDFRILEKQARKENAVFSRNFIYTTNSVSDGFE